MNREKKSRKRGRTGDIFRALFLGDAQTMSIYTQIQDSGGEESPIHLHACRQACCYHVWAGWRRNVHGNHHQIKKDKKVEVHMGDLRLYCRTFTAGMQSGPLELRDPDNPDWFSQAGLAGWQVTEGNQIRAIPHRVWGSVPGVFVTHKSIGYASSPQGLQGSKVANSAGGFAE